MNTLNDSLQTLHDAFLSSLLKALEGTGEGPNWQPPAAAIYQQAREYFKDNDFKAAIPPGHTRDALEKAASGLPFPKKT